MLDHPDGVILIYEAVSCLVESPGLWPSSVSLSLSLCRLGFPEHFPASKLSRKKKQHSKLMLSKLITTFAKKFVFQEEINTEFRVNPTLHSVSCKPYSPLYFALIFGLKCQQDVGEN